MIKSNYCFRAMIVLVAALVAQASAQASAQTQTTTSSAPTSYTVENLGTLGGGFTFANDLNDSGQVAGYSKTADNQNHAFLYSGGEMKDLGTLGGNESAAYALNDSGQVVGTAGIAHPDYFHAFLYSGGEMKDLGTLGSDSGSVATDVNDSGQVTGYSPTFTNGGSSHAFLYSGGEMKDLGTLGGRDGDGSEARDVNESGQVVGISTLPFATHAFLYSEGEMKDLGTLGGNESAATKVNNSGQVVGSASTTDNQGHAFLYSGGEMKDLGTLGGSKSHAIDVNDSGQVAGNSKTKNDSSTHAFLYSGGEMKDLGTFGGSESYAFDVNDSGQVVGYSYIDDESRPRAFLYGGDQMKDLNDLIPAGSGVVLTDAREINDSGQILAYGNANGQYGPFLLTPAPDDKTAPAAPGIASPLNNSYDTDGTIAFSGSAEANSTVKIFEGTTLKDQTKASPSGDWSRTISGVTNGKHTYTAKAVDAAGNASEASAARTVIVDTVKPRVIKTFPLAGAKMSANANVTADFSESMNPNTLVVADAQNKGSGATVKLVRKTSAGTTLIAATMTYDAPTRKITINPTNDLRTGTYTVTIVSGLTLGAADRAGNKLDQKPTVSGNQKMVWSFTV